jgi:hypothetical protein
MFGSATSSGHRRDENGDIYNPETLQKVDRITKRVIGLKGGIPYQILSIAHPKVKSITAREGALQIREIFYPEVPKTQRRRPGEVRGLAHEGRARRSPPSTTRPPSSTPAFWEEALDFRDLYKSLTELKAQEDDANHTIYITGRPGCTRRCSSTRSSFSTSSSSPS